MAIIGIDLGTTNSLAVCWKNDKPVLIRNSFNETSTPSVVGYDKENETYVVGAVANERLITHPNDTISEFKRCMGQNMEFMLNNRKETSVSLSSYVLKKIKEDAEAFLGEEVDEAIISVPAYFNDKARSDTKLAAELAGLRVDRLINEPSAAALSYLYSNGFEDQTLLIIDFGGGTLDVSLVETFDNIIEILAVAGNNELGGKDFNEVIAEYFCKQSGLVMDALRLQDKALIYKIAEKAKIQLSKSMSTIMTATIEGKDYSVSIDNNKLIKLCSSIFSKIKAPIDKVLRDARTTIDDIDDIVLVGGSSKMPTVRAFIKEVTGKAPNTNVNPDTAIALGAGIFAEIKNRNMDLKDIIMTDICPFSLGVATCDSMTGDIITEFIINRNSSLPCTRQKTFYTMSPMQESIRIQIYQGESIVVSKNLCLGELMIDLAHPTKEKQMITIKMSYDINGILIVDVEDKDGHIGDKVFMSKDTDLSPEEINKMRERIKAASILGREEEKNALLIARAERVFEESLEQERQIILAFLMQFKASLTSNSLKAINEAYTKLKDLLDNIEGRN